VVVQLVVRTVVVVAEARPAAIAVALQAALLLAHVANLQHYTPHKDRTFCGELLFVFLRYTLLIQKIFFLAALCYSMFYNVLPDSKCKVLFLLSEESLKLRVNAFKKFKIQ